MQRRRDWSLACVQQLSTLHKSGWSCLIIGLCDPATTQGSPTASSTLSLLTGRRKLGDTEYWHLIFLLIESSTLIRPDLTVFVILNPLWEDILLGYCVNVSGARFCKLRGPEVIWCIKLLGNEPFLKSLRALRYRYIEFRNSEQITTCAYLPFWETIIELLISKVADCTLKFTQLPFSTRDELKAKLNIGHLVSSLRAL